MILIAYDVRRYREILNSVVKDGDTVIEIGPHLGEGTKLYASRTKLTVAVDKGIQAETAFIKLQKNLGMWLSPMGSDTCQRQSLCHI